jgi:hypothetical protein
MTTSQDRVPQLTRDGESIWRLEDFDALIAAGVVPLETTAEIKQRTGTAPEVSNAAIHDNMARASRGFKALLAYAEDYDRVRGLETKSLIADLLNDLHHLSDAYGVSLETVLRVADASYTYEID